MKALEAGKDPYLGFLDFPTLRDWARPQRSNSLAVGWRPFFLQLAVFCTMLMLLLLPSSYKPERTGSHSATTVALKHFYHTIGKRRLSLHQTFKHSQWWTQAIVQGPVGVRSYQVHVSTSGGMVYPRNHRHLHLTTETQRSLPPDEEIHNSEPQASVSPQNEQPPELDVPAQAVSEPQSVPTPLEDVEPLPSPANCSSCGRVLRRPA